MVAVLSNDNYPVKVSISVTTESLDRQAYQRACFICEANSELTGTFVVRSLADILALGFIEDSKAYKFGQTFFQQSPRMELLYLKLKTSNETYVKAFEETKKSSYFFVAIESKVVSEILNFSERMEIERKAFVVSHGDPLLGNQLANRSNTIFIYNGETPTVPPQNEEYDMGNTIIFSRESSNLIPYDLISLVYVDNVLIFDRSNPDLPYTSELAFGQVGIAQVGINSEGGGGTLTALRNMSPQDKQVRVTLAMNPEYYGEDTEYFRHEVGIPLLHTDPLLNTNMSFTTTYNPATQADYEIQFKLKGTPAPVLADVPVGVPSPLSRIGLKNVDYVSNEKFIIQVYASDFIADQESYLYRDGFRLLLTQQGVLPQDGIDYSLKNDYRFSMQNHYATGEQPTIVGDNYFSSAMMIELPYLRNADYVLKVTRLSKPWAGAVEFDPDYEYYVDQGDPALLADYGSPRLSGATFSGNVMTIKINKSEEG